MEFILYLAIIIAATKIAGHLSARLGQPAVLGELIVGVLLGPAVLGVLEPEASYLHYFSEIGVLLLMFLAGMETDLAQLQRNWKAAFAVAIGGIVLPFIGGYSAALAFGFSSDYAMFFGILFCATSVSISVQVLKEMNRLGSREGTTILGAAVVDDVLVVILLAVMMSVLGTGNDVSLGLLIGKKVIFFVVVIAVGWFVIPKAMEWLAKLRVSEAVISIAVAICFGFAYFAEYMGMAGIIGSFAAGIALSQTPLHKEMERKLEPIAYSIFVPVFFVSIGLNVSFDGLGSQIGFVIVISIVAILTKLLGGGLGARLTGFDTRSSIAVGSGMISRGEVALIIASTGQSASLLQEEYYTSVIIMVIVTTLVTPPILKWIFSRMPEKETA
ncbi:cation:proton antiporter [Cohnella thailandensis]|uniref:Cation:proton antiporter n=1 Tax=Cohnella thailandensis TaxID=557557 RepID=A0A841T647_9BACL|nr:cation:proton antiporter [Cohnella thailandensis]MBB6638419.1 cation:proton antiporter [Cohnella thailandensis]MBP1977103.1 monovalent cation:proton antiporter-2 (CPA2) family protein [Cohnella thailandensis]